jgi:two-component system sensor histidine kinase UhpB
MVMGQRRLLALHRGFAQRLLAAQEDERARVAREVHDDAVQRLAVVRRELLEFQSATNLSTTDRHRLTGIQGDVEDLTVSLRALAHQLHPSVIEQLGLVAALRQLADEAGRAGLTVTLGLPAEAPALRADRALVLYRVAQESLRNVQQHAGVEQASLGLETENGTVTLVVEDRGRGFDPGSRRRSHGLGLIGMNERAELVGGKAAIQAQPGQGTRVTVSVPQGLGP